MADVHERRAVVRRAVLRDALERHRPLREPPVVGGAGSAVDGARPQPGVGGAVEPEAARDPDRPQLLREALQPAAGEREVAIDPDVGAVRHLLAVEKRVHDEEELAVLRARRVGELVAALGERLPVGEDRGAAARVRVGLEPGRKHGADCIRIGPVLDHEEVTDVVPRRVRDERGTSLRGARRRVAAAQWRRRQRLAEQLEALTLPLDRGRVEAEVRARRQRPPGVGGKAVVRPVARHVVVAELLHVAVELDEALLLDDPHVARDVAADAVPHRAPPEPAAVAGQPVEQVAHLADVDDVEGEVVEVRVALVDQRHHVVVGADAKPDPLCAEAVADAHPEDVAVEAHDSSSCAVRQLT